MSNEPLLLGPGYPSRSITSLPNINPVFQLGYEGYLVFKKDVGLGLYADVKGKILIGYLTSNLDRTIDCIQKYNNIEYNNIVLFRHFYETLSFAGVNHIKEIFTELSWFTTDALAYLIPDMGNICFNRLPKIIRVSEPKGKEFLRLCSSSIPKLYQASDVSARFYLTQEPSFLYIKIAKEIYEYKIPAYLIQNNKLENEGFIEWLQGIFASLCYHLDYKFKCGKYQIPVINDEHGCTKASHMDTISLAHIYSQLENLYKQSGNFDKTELFN